MADHHDACCWNAAALAGTKPGTSDSRVMRAWYWNTTGYEKPVTVLAITRA